MRLPPRRSDDADLIRARLRVLLDEGGRARGWVPDDGLDETDDLEPAYEPAALEAGSVPGLPDGIGRHRVPGPAVRLAPARRGAWALWLAGSLAALVVAAGTWFDRPRVEPAPEPAAPAAPAASSPSSSSGASPATPSVGVAADASPSVVVSVVGLVNRPGLVTLPTGARVADAVAAAGGLTPEADPASVNLAAVVTDGEQIAVGVPGAAPAGPAAGGASGSGPVDLNTATVADLDALPGIGPVLAQRIVDHREQQGRFTSVEQLDDVPGIGPAIYAELVELVTV